MAELGGACCRKAAMKEDRKKGRCEDGIVTAGALLRSSRSWGVQCWIEARSMSHAAICVVYGRALKGGLSLWRGGDVRAERGRLWCGQTEAQCTNPDVDRWRRGARRTYCKVERTRDGQSGSAKAGVSNRGVVTGRGEPQFGAAVAVAGRALGVSEGRCATGDLDGQSGSFSAPFYLSCFYSIEITSCLMKEG